MNSPTEDSPASHRAELEPREALRDLLMAVRSAAVPLTAVAVVFFLLGMLVQALL